MLTHLSHLAPILSLVRDLGAGMLDQRLQGGGDSVTIATYNVAMYKVREHRTCVHVQGLVQSDQEGAQKVIQQLDIKSVEVCA